jgi:PadR family transcriptional regulator
MKSDKELVGASTSLLVLGILAKEPSYGYEVVRRVNDEAEGLFEWQEGTVYPVLHKLEKEGMVRAQWQDANTGRRRKYYYITAPGREALSSQVEKWNAFHGLVNRIAEVPNG